LSISDCADCDFRIGKVAAQDWPEDSQRPLYQYKGAYPSTITSSRGKTWHPDNLEGTKEQITEWGLESPITGYIPQVSKVKRKKLWPVHCVAPHTCMVQHSTGRNNGKRCILIALRSGSSSTTTTQ
jgi:hypothetical protein